MGSAMSSLLKFGGVTAAVMSGLAGQAHASLAASCTARHSAWSAHELIVDVDATTGELAVQETFTERSPHDSAMITHYTHVWDVAAWQTGTDEILVRYAERRSIAQPARTCQLRGQLSRRAGASLAGRATLVCDGAPVRSYDCRWTLNSARD